jgi:formylglycine-generating enzyme
MHSLRDYRGLTLLLAILLAGNLLGCSGSGGSKTTPQAVSRSANSAQAVSPSQAGLLGDLDGDGVPTVGDAIRILRIVVGLDADDERADANQNDSTDVGDAIMVLRCVVGLDDWPIGGVTATVGAGGGTVTTGDGNVTLEVPAGALDSETEITVAPQMTYPADERLVPGTCYEFGPDGTQFAVAVQMTLAYDEANLPAEATEADLAIHRVVGDGWEAVADSAVDTVAKTVSAPVSGFSTYGVLDAGSDGGPFDEIIGLDGQGLVLVPGGSFMMGSEDGEDDERPVHQVTLTGFWIGKCEVTNDQYAAFLNEVQPTNVLDWLGIGEPACGIEYVAGTYRSKSQLGSHPVVEVNWHGAQAYCEHYGYVLPTEAQWEYAAAGPDARTYPWGNVWAPEKCCNGVNRGPFGSTFPVGSFPAGASWCGALDMAGNVQEWCADWYSETYYEVSPKLDPRGPANGGLKVCRGGSWYDYSSKYLRGAYRDEHVTGNHISTLGFRCAQGG